MRRFGARAVVVTTGTFLRGRLHIGTTTALAGGRAGEGATTHLAEQLEAAGITPGMSVLEPSAGMGHIADRIREADAEPDPERCAYQGAFEPLTSVWSIGHTAGRSTSKLPSSS